ncbi:hypothetical protein ACFE04_008475 [Oxalis oulophora]
MKYVRCVRFGCSKPLPDKIEKLKRDIEEADKEKKTLESRAVEADKKIAESSLNQEKVSPFFRRPIRNRRAFRKFERALKFPERINRQYTSSMENPIPKISAGSFSMSSVMTSSVHGLSGDKRDHMLMKVK